jgi:mRNA interferase MazF
LTTGVVLRGDIFLVNLDPVVGAETAKTRPCVVIQNDIGNAKSPVTIVACITSQIPAKLYPTNVLILAKETGLDKDSVVLLNQIWTVDKRRLGAKIAKIPEKKMLDVDAALRLSLDLEYV